MCLWPSFDLFMALARSVMSLRFMNGNRLRLREAQAKSKTATPQLDYLFHIEHNFKTSILHLRAWVHDSVSTGSLGSGCLEDLLACWIWQTILLRWKQRLVICVRGRVHQCPQAHRTLQTDEHASIHAVCWTNWYQTWQTHYALKLLGADCGLPPPRSGAPFGASCYKDSTLDNWKLIGELPSKLDLKRLRLQLSSLPRT